MPEHWSLNGFYDIAKATALYEAIPLRESCRCFASAPSTQQWNTLLAAADSLALPGTRMALGLCDTSLFQPLMGMLMKFENVQRFAAVITQGDDPQALVNAGIGGEMLMLTAVANGMAGVWVAGTYKHGALDVTLAEGEKVAALIALGVPKAQPKPPLNRKRKELAKICSANFSEMPTAFWEVAMHVQAAPSAMNLQPWYLSYEPADALVLSVKRAANRLDLGIAVCHAVLAMGQTPATFALAPDALSVRITL